MSAWEEAVVLRDVARAIHAASASVIPWDELQDADIAWWEREAEVALDALAPHLAALKGETWAQACEASADWYERTGWRIDEAEVGSYIRALAPPQPQSGGTE